MGHHYNALEWESKFTLGLNAEKIIDYVKKYTSNESCLELNFLQNTRCKHISIYATSGDRGLQKFDIMISSEVLPENELIIQNFVVSFIRAFQLLL